MLLAQKNVQLHLHFKQPSISMKDVGIAQVQFSYDKQSKMI